LVSELKTLGASNIEIDDKCYVYATIPSNIPQNDPAYGKVPAIGFIAHVDTSPDTTGTDVKPQIIENYKGGDIVLPADNNIVIKVSECPAMNKCIGHTVVTTDGTTLLGSDDKSGIAAIMTAAEYFINNPDVIHGDIRIGFTPDEEIGRGANFFNVEKFNCKYAYTIDGEMPGEINKETFSANACIVRAYGRDIHPGFGKDIMVNSIRAIADVIALMPRDMAPETTEGYEPYIHPHKLSGTVDYSELNILFRDFKTEGLEVQKQMMEEIVAKVQESHPKVRFEIEVIEYYRNMLELLEAQPDGLD
jgi:tripeptide aminopeptidase